mgnify:CR=1 FL=1
MAASLLSCLVSLGISFLITPTVIDKLGAEAQGFVTMANNFVSYAAIMAMALNSMAGRFITVKIHQNDHDLICSKYFLCAIDAFIRGKAFSVANQHICLIF